MASFKQNAQVLYARLQASYEDSEINVNLHYSWRLLNTYCWLV